MSNTTLDVWLTFPLTPEQEPEFEELCDALGCIEYVEEAFDMEFSCGDGLFLSDIENDDSLLAKHDGNVCTNSMPRHRFDGKEFIPRKSYRFTAKYLEKHEEIVFSLNNKETCRKSSHRLLWR